MDLVSIIIPAFNSERTLAQTLDSVIGQTYKNIEVIVVNDGSTDRTDSVIKFYQRKDKRIVSVQQENVGCSAAKNTGLNIANGKFINYLDADDILSHDKIENQLREIENDPLAVAVCKTKIFNRIEDLNGGEEISTSFLFTTTDVVSFVLNLYGLNGTNGMIQPNAFLISSALASKVGEWDTNISPSPDEDGEYFCRVLVNADKVIFTKGINYYRKDVNFLSLSKHKSVRYAYGSIKSTKLKASHVLKRRDTIEVRTLFAKEFANIAYQFGYDFPEIINLVEKEIRLLGFNEIPLCGGNSFKKASALLGFRSAMKIKRLVGGKL